jgi:hypothetical protein
MIGSKTKNKLDVVSCLLVAKTISIFALPETSDTSEAIVVAHTTATNSSLARTTEPDRRRYTIIIMVHRAHAHHPW